MGCCDRKCNLSTFDLGYLSIDSLSEGVGASQILTLVEELSKLDLNISLITFEKGVPPSWVIDRVNTAGITWTPLAFQRSGTLGGAGRILRLIKNVPDAKVIHGRSDLPTLAGLLGSDIPTLWDIRSLWSEQRALLNPKQWNAATKLALLQIENFDARKSTAISTLTHAVVPYLDSRYPDLPKIRTVVPTCVNLDKFALSKMPSGEFTTVLSGTFNKLYDLDLTKKLIEEVRRTKKLKVIWARDSIAKNEALDIGENIVISLPHSEMPAIISDSHFGFSICRRDAGSSLKAAAPTKIGEFLASGRPIFVTKGIGDFDDLLPKWGAGVVIEDESEAPLKVQELFDILKDPETPQRCRALAEDTFDIKKAAKTYASTYRAMTRE